MEDLNSYFT